MILGKPSSRRIGTHAKVYRITRCHFFDQIDRQGREGREQVARGFVRHIFVIQRALKTSGG